MVKLAPSPPETYSAPSGPKAMVPIEWLGNCWHQSQMIGVSVTELPSPLLLTVSRESRPEATHPSVVAPGGVGQASFHFGVVLCPRMRSYVYRT